jgi:hypothetical protein
LLGLLGIGFLFLFFIASVELLHFTESEAFCTSCHVMHPEEAAYEVSPHARTECGTCHVGPGALAAVQAKLANLRYLWVYPLNLYERPIPSPITSLRPTEVVCEQCHWPEKFYDDRLAVIPEYAQDEENSLTQTALALKTGGGTAAQGLGRGIHWHIENPVYYIATDEKRQEIPWVQAEYNGVVTEYIDAESPYTPEELAQMEKRKMDCVDCHNRASHNFRRPDDVIDQAMTTGLLPADLPELKKQGVAVLERKYATEEEAADAIASVEDFYKTNYPDVYAQREVDVKAAVSGLQGIFDTTQFPFMNLTWESHKNNIGHKDFPGCFRCHDGKHLSANNEAIRLECNVCHSIPQVADPGEPLPPIPIASQPQPPSHHSTTWLSEHRFRFDASCVACHTVENPGGSDNSSFCSNSACHATEWKYAGLDAPAIRELSAPPRQPSSGQPNPIPHPITANTNCLNCHGPQGVHPAPESHESFTPDMCTGCHAAAMQETAATATPTGAAEATPAAVETPAAESSEPPGIPHSVQAGTDCAVCHGLNAARPYPENHTAFTPAMCQNCHQPMVAAEEATATSEPTVAPEPTGTASVTPASEVEETGGPPAIPHAVQEGIACTTCHGENGIKPYPTSHASFSAESCTGCHLASELVEEDETPAPAATASPTARATANLTATPRPTATRASSGAGEAPAMPHALVDRDDCTLCHGPGKVKPNPPDHAGRSAETCQICHKPIS